MPRSKLPPGPSAQENVRRNIDLLMTRDDVDSYQVAKWIELSYNSVRGKLKGIIGFSIEEIEAIAAGFAVPIETLFQPPGSGLEEEAVRAEVARLVAGKPKPVRRRRGPRNNTYYSGNPGTITGSARQVLGVPA